MCVKKKFAIYMYTIIERQQYVRRYFIVQRNRKEKDKGGSDAEYINVITMVWDWMS